MDIPRSEPNTRSKRLAKIISFVGRYPAPFVFLLLSILGLAIYSNSFHASFQFDDDRWITDNPAVWNLSNIGAIWKYSQSRFLITLSLALNYHFHGAEVFGYHLVNFLIHLFASFSVYCLVQLIFQSPRLSKNLIKEKKDMIALFASFIFLSHPIQTQAVTYIIQRTASLATLFYLLAVIAYFKARSSPKKYLFFYFAALAMAFASIMTKEIAFTMPLTILLCEWVFFTSPPEQISRKLMRALPFFLILPIVLHFWGVRIGGSDNWLAAADTKAISRTHYLLTQFNVIRTYIRLLLIPVNQALDYTYPIANHFFEPRTFLSFLFLASIVWLAIKLFKTKPLTSFGIFWFFITLSVESSIIPIRDVIYEHRLYLPMVGASIAVCAELPRFVKQTRWYVILLSCVVLVFSIMTFQRNWVWQSPLTLWADNAKKFPRSIRANQNVGNEYSRRKEFDKAIDHFNQALQVYPEGAEVYNSLGNVYAEKKDFEKAKQCYENAALLKPDYLAPRFNEAVMLFNMGQKEEGVKGLEDISRMDVEVPPETYYNLGAYYAELCDYGKAIEYYKKALQFGPNHPVASQTRQELEEMTPLPGKTLEGKEKACQTGKLFKKLRKFEYLRTISELNKLVKLRELARPIVKVYKPVSAPQAIRR